MEIRRVSAAIARSVRRGVPERHVDDEDARSVHLGAFAGEALVGSVSGVPVGPEGQTDGEWFEVIGPFGEHRPELVDALAAARDRGGLWAPDDRPTLVRAGNRWQRHLGGYTAEDIVVLEGVEAVRRRPGMYVGGTGRRAVAHLTAELVSNAVDEHLAGHATHLWVTRGPVGVTVTDDGRGIPVDEGPDLLVALCTKLWAGSHRGSPRRHVHVGLHGLGLPVVSALSSAMVITVDRGRRFQQTFAAGRALGPLVDVGPAQRRGTSVWFVPDVGLLDADEIDATWLDTSLRDVAVLNPALAVHLDGARVPSYGGLLGYARHLAGDVQREWSTSGSSDGITAEIAVCWGTGAEQTSGWANQLPCIGSHLRGLNAGLAGTPREGRVALISVTLEHATYSGRTRETLSVPAVEDLVRSIVAAEFGPR